MATNDSQDAISVHKYLKAKFISEENNLTFGIYEDTFHIISPTGKPIICTKKLDEILEHLKVNGYDDPGYYVS